MRRALFAGFISTQLLLSAPALAGADDEAQGLFDEAKQLIMQGRWGEACPKLARSNQLEPRATTLFRLAECYETIGKHASAWNAYLGSAAASAAAGETKRAEFAQQRAKRVEPSVPYMIITVNQRPVTVFRDGERVDDTRLGTKIPVDAGEHTIIVEAPGKQRFLSTVSIVDAATTIVSVPPLSDAISERAVPADTSVPASARAAPPGATGQPGPHAAVAPSSPSNPTMRRWSILMSGVGLAAAGTGAALALTADTTDGCKGKCGLGTGLLIGGGLLAATGLAFFLASFGDDSGAARVSKARPFELRF